MPPFRDSARVGPPLDRRPSAIPRESHQGRHAREGLPGGEGDVRSREPDVAERPVVEPVELGERPAFGSPSPRIGHLASRPPQNGKHRPEQSDAAGARPTDGTDGRPAGPRTATTRRPIHRIAALGPVRKPDHTALIRQTMSTVSSKESLTFKRI